MSYRLRQTNGTKSVRSGLPALVFLLLTITASAQQNAATRRIDEMFQAETVTYSVKNYTDTSKATYFFTKADNQLLKVWYFSTKHDTVSFFFFKDSVCRVDLAIGKKRKASYYFDGGKLVGLIKNDLWARDPGRYALKADYLLEESKRFRRRYRY
ncbi:MAG: hypothetical protein EOO05_08680 [Chitinophagaceae bacterium]|nr:MAG: hypothetical protein EOO05_08680 [Chitinophagaceae bacterium]